MTTPRVAGGPGEVARDLLDSLYPPPLVLRGGGPVTQASGTWWAVPSLDQPRLLVPALDRRATAAVVRRQLAGRRLRTRASRALLSGVALTGLPARLDRHRVWLSGPDGASRIEDVLAQVLGCAPDELHLAMPIGPPRANRKPVLQVCDARGAVLAYAKVGVTPLTGRLVRHEAGALSQLADARLTHVRAPELLGMRPWRGGWVIVQTALHVPRRRLGGEAGRRRLLTLVDEIARMQGLRWEPWGAHPYRERLLERLDRCGPHASALRGHLPEGAEGVEVPVVSWHGDLNPGNLALVRGPCPVWDWERLEHGVPLGLDLLHHDLDRDLNTRRVPPQRAAGQLLVTAPRVLAPLGVPPAVASLTARVYLVGLACRYLADGQAAAGSRLGRVENWLLPALEEAS